MIIDSNDVDILIFDFDGVLTNNCVYLNQQGIESVRCSRSDGLAFDVLRALDKEIYIISTEVNPVVRSRAEKLQVQVLHGVGDKLSVLNSLLLEKNIDAKRALYVGNDLNDYHAMKLCGYKIAPSDSHRSICDLADVVLLAKGGEGVVRELIEEVFGLDVLSILY